MKEFFEIVAALVSGFMCVIGICIMVIGVRAAYVVTDSTEWLINIGFVSIGLNVILLFGIALFWLTTEKKDRPPNLQTINS